MPSTDALAVLATAAEIADTLDVHPETIRRLFRAGRVPGYKVGRYLRFDPTEVREALRSTPAGAPDFDDQAVVR